MRAPRCKWRRDGGRHEDERGHPGHLPGRPGRRDRHGDRGGSEETSPDSGNWRDHEIAALYNVLAVWVLDATLGAGTALRRLLQAIPTFFGVTIIAFLMMSAAVPWIGALMAARSAPWRRCMLPALMSGR